MTDQQAQALYSPWTSCLNQHGARTKVAGPGAIDAAVTACKHLQPLPAWQLDPTNPEARAFIGRTVTCLRAKGYQARAVQKGLMDTGFPGVEFWGVSYTPSIVGIEPKTEADEAACHQGSIQ